MVNKVVNAELVTHLQRIAKTDQVISLAVVNCIEADRTKLLTVASSLESISIWLKDQTALSCCVDIDRFVFISGCLMPESLGQLSINAARLSGFDACVGVSSGLSTMSLFYRAERALTTAIQLGYDRYHVAS